MGCFISQLHDSASSAGDASQPLFFHPSSHGSKVLLDKSCSLAERASTFRDGIVFTQRPIRLKERVTLKILKEEAPWHGGLRVGFTTMDPSKIEPALLPPFVCPNLVLQGKTWAAVLPDECGKEGTVLSFWADRRGRLFFRSSREAQDVLLLKGVAAAAPLWAVIDVYGHTKAVQLLDPTRPCGGTCELTPAPRLSPPATLHAPVCRDYLYFPGGPAEECAICLSHEASARLHPCGHANFCHCCAQRVFRSNARCPMCRQQIQDVLQASPEA